MKYNTKMLKRELRHTLHANRYEHTLGVAYTAAALAMRYKSNVENAYVAGLLHDCAKYMSSKEMLLLCEEYSIEVTPTEERNPFLLHAKLGSYLAKENYHVDDPMILDAIKYHTTGRIGMTPLDKIVFVADYIEPERRKVSNLVSLRQLAFQDLNSAMVVIMHDTLAYLQRSQAEIDDLTQQAYEYYKEREKQK